MVRQVLRALVWALQEHGARLARAECHPWGPGHRSTLGLHR